MYLVKNLKTVIKHNTSFSQTMRKYVGLIVITLVYDGKIVWQISTDSDSIFVAVNENISKNSHRFFKHRIYL